MTGTWTYGTWTSASPASGNLIKGLLPSSANYAYSPGEGAKSVAVWTDAEVSTTISKARCVGNNATVTFTFPYPSRIDSLKFYTSSWSGRNNITISSIVFADDQGWACDTQPSVNYQTAGGWAGWAKLSDPDGGALCACAQSVTINFGTQENNYVGFSEIEVVGEPECYRRVAVDPTGCVEPTPDIGRAAFTSGEELTFSTRSGSFVDASKCYIYTFKEYEIAYADGTAVTGKTASVTFSPTQAFTLTWRYDRATNPEVDVMERRLLAYYAQDGLLAHWDGIYNGGTNDAHSTDRTSWRDIAGDHDLAAHGSYALPTWDATDGAKWTGSSSGQSMAYDAGAGSKFLTANTNITLELVGECSSYSGNNIGVFCSSETGSSYSYGTMPIGARYAGGGIYYTFGSGQSQLWTSGMATSGNGSFCLTHVVDGSRNVILYYRGEKVKTQTNGATVRGCRNLVFGAAGGDYGAGATYTLRGVRVYTRALTPGEVRHNYAMDCARHYGGSVGDTAYYTAGTPKNYASPTPAYGTSATSAGVSLKLTVADTLTTYSDGLRAKWLAADERAVYLGYTVKTNGVEVQSGSDETDHYTVLAASPGATTLDWRWRREFLVTAAQSGYEGSTVEIAGATTGGAVGGSTTAWAPDGATVTIRAVACAGAKFSGWAGDTDGVADVTQAETTLLVGQGNVLSAVFVDAHHDPVTVTLKSGASGDWFDAANWEGGSAPQEGDTVLLTPSDGTSPSLTLSASPPHLAKVVLSNGTAKCTTTLAFANWETCLDADEVIVGDRATVKVSSGFYDTAMSNRVWIAASNLVVTALGRISADNAGWAPGNGTCRKLANGASNGSTAGAYGGLGGDVWSGDFSVTATTAKQYGSAAWPYDPGCGYGSDSPKSSALADSGGGAIFLDVTDGDVVLDGKVTADSAVVSSSGGGVLIVCATIDGTGTVSACVADYYGLYSGAGGGGRIAIHYDPTLQTARDATCRLTLRARGGYGCNADSSFMMRMGGPGTVWLPDARFLTSATYGGRWPFSGEFIFGDGTTTFDQPETDVLVNNEFLYFTSLRTFRCRSMSAKGLYSRTRGFNFKNAAVTILRDVALTNASLKVTGGTLSVGGDVLLAPNATKWQGGELWADAVATNAPGQFGVSVNITGTLDVGNQAIVYPRCHASNNAIPKFDVGSFCLREGGKVDGKGFGSSGKAVASTLVGGAGSSHGGRGADSYDRSKYCYGDEKHPVCPGSGCNTRGGGVFYLTAANRGLLDGTIDCSAQSESTGAPGSGGSVYLTIPKIVSSSHGTISANGGSGPYPAGGGRIAIWSKAWIPSTLTCSVAAGTTSGTFTYPAQPGTIYKYQTRGLCVIVR